MARAAATTPMKQTAARQMRRTAALLDADHPETVAGDHLRDAAKVLERGSLDGAKRHLDAAMEVLTPRNLIRHGITDDEGHATAKHHMHQVHRHRLAVQDIEDTSGRNDRLRAMARAARGQPEAREPFPPPEPGQVAAAGQPGQVIDLKAAWIGEARGPGGQWSGSKGSVFGSHLSKSEARGFASMLGSGTHQHGGTSKKSELGELSRSQRKVYDHLRKKGMKHGKALRGAQMPPSDFARALARVMTHVSDQPGSAVTDLAAWEHERRGRGGEWAAGAVDAIMSHPQLAAMDPQDRAVVESHLKQARSASDHTTAEMHLTDARRRATRTGAGDLAKAISKVHAYHRLAAIEGIGVKPMMSQAAYNRFIKQEQAWPRPKPRVVPGRGSQPPFTLATELSARTAMLERTPAPRGRPGGPGLYDVSGMGHTAYLQQVVKALIEKRGMPEGKAYAIARAAIRKWGVRSKHPEVKSAAIRAESGELARQARAKASHGHANALAAIELVGPKGYVHGWRFVGIPAVGAKITLPRGRRGTVIGGDHKHARVRAVNGDIYHIPHDKGSRNVRLVKDASKPEPKPERLSLERQKLKRQADASIARGGEILFHGTPRELKVGDVIDAKHANARVTQLHGGKQYAFASTDAGEATFAGKAGSAGHVYRVEPVSKYEFDTHQGSATSRRTTSGFRVVEEVQKWSGAKMSHGHANEWDVTDALIELACDSPDVIDLFNPNHSPTGQFTTAAGAGQGQGKQGGSRKARRAALLKKAAGLRSQIRGLEAQLHAATSRSHRSKSSTPAKKGAGATSAKGAKAGKTASGKARAPAASTSMSPATIRGKIAALRAELAATLAQLRKLK